MDTWLIELGYRYDDCECRVIEIEVQELYVGSKDKAEEYRLQLLERYKHLMKERVNYREESGYAVVYLDPDGNYHSRDYVFKNYKPSSRRGWKRLEAGIGAVDFEDPEYTCICRVVKPHLLQELEAEHLRVKEIIEEVYK